MYEGLLPAGSIVLLKNSDVRVMITGFIQRVEENGNIADYSGVVWPLGYLGSEYNLVFNREDIDSIYQLGYQDAEQNGFQQWINGKLQEVRQVSAN